MASSSIPTKLLFFAAIVPSTVGLTYVLLWVRSLSEQPVVNPVLDQAHHGRPYGFGGASFFFMCGLSIFLMLLYRRLTGSRRFDDAMSDRATGKLALGKQAMVGVGFVLLASAFLVMFWSIGDQVDENGISDGTPLGRTWHPYAAVTTITPFRDRTGARLRVAFADGTHWEFAGHRNDVNPSVLEVADYISHRSGKPVVPDPGWK